MPALVPEADRLPPVRLIKVNEACDPQAIAVAEVPATLIELEPVIMKVTQLFVKVKPLVAVMLENSIVVLIPLRVKPGPEPVTVIPLVEIG
jgi:hypothetical protein